MATVTLDQMKSKLLTTDEVVKQLEKTEPLSAINLDSTNDIAFSLDIEVMSGIGDKASTDEVDAQITVDGTEFALSKDALFQAAANFGLSSAYVRKIPATLTEKLLNYHYGQGLGDETFKLLKVKDVASAFTRDKLVPFSNLSLVENVIGAIDAKYGDVPVFADYKFSNTLRQTDVRFIIPSLTQTIDSTMLDVPQDESDVWYAGVHLSNSVIGKAQTRVEPYLFRWWCTNGATTTVDVPAWHRKKDGQGDDVYKWAADTVNELFGHYDDLFDQIQALNNLDITGNTADVLKQIFDDYKVPVSQRNQIMDTLLAQSPITMYALMNAITRCANDPDLSPERADRLMRIGGAIPTSTFDTLKAKIWREGHQAEAEAPNPYEPVLI